MAEVYELFKGKKNLKVRFSFRNAVTNALIDISSYTTTKTISYKINNADVAIWTGSIENNYYLVYTIPELTSAGLWVLQGYVEDSSGNNLFSKFVYLSVKPELT